MHQVETGLAGIIRNKIADSEGGWIPFRDFMEMALYDPKYGYYMKEQEKNRSIRRFLHSLLGRRFARGMRRALYDWRGEVSGSRSGAAICRVGRGGRPVCAAVSRRIEGSGCLGVQTGDVYKRRGESVPPAASNGGAGLSCRSRAIHNAGKLDGWRDLGAGDPVLERAAGRFSGSSACPAGEGLDGAWRPLRR